MDVSSHRESGTGSERAAPLADVTPPPSHWSAAAWAGGVFQRASRPWTEIVEGRIKPSSPLLMVTLSGGAARHELSTDDGLRFDGPDRAGQASFLPAGCERRLRLHGVEWAWASITLGGACDDATAQSLSSVPAFCAVHDPVLRGGLAELARVHAADGALDPAYCDAFAAMLTAYLRKKFGARQPEVSSRKAGLTGRHLRRLGEYVDAHLDQPIRVASLADALLMSEGHLHRALKATTGETPLAFVNRCRVERAAELLRTQVSGVHEVALAVGFTSPSAFARVFREAMGHSPSAYRRRFET